MSDLSPALTSITSGLEPSLGGKPSPYAHLSAEELVELLGKETEKYWKLSEGVTARTRTIKYAKYLAQLELFNTVCDELKYRPHQELLLFKRLLDHTNPGVVVSIAEKFAEYLVEEDVAVLRDYCLLPFRDNGCPESFAARSYGVLGYLNNRGRISGWTPPW